MKPINNRYFCKSALRSKMIFTSKEEADRFIRFNSKEMLDNHARKVPVRSYFCTLCNGWHTTSNPDIEFFSSYHSKAETTMLNIFEKKEKDSRRSRLMSDSPTFAAVCSLFKEGMPFEAMRMIINFCHRNNSRFINTEKTIIFLYQSFELIVEYIRTVDIRTLDNYYIIRYKNLHRSLVRITNKTDADFEIYLTEMRNFKTNLPPIIFSETDKERKRQITMGSIVRRHLNYVTKQIKLKRIEQAEKRIMVATRYINQIAERYEDKKELISMIDNLIELSKNIEQSSC